MYPASRPKSRVSVVSQIAKAKAKVKARAKAKAVTKKDGKQKARIFNKDGIDITNDEDLTNDDPRFYPHLTRRPDGGLEFPIMTARYATCQDKRGAIPVYEYELEGFRLPDDKPNARHFIVWDRQNGKSPSFLVCLIYSCFCFQGDVLFTGIWQCLTSQKTDIVRVAESTPGVKITKIRGGCLKIQGTWYVSVHSYPFLIVFI